MCNVQPQTVPPSARSERKASINAPLVIRDESKRAVGRKHPRRSALSLAIHGRA